LDVESDFLEKDDVRRLGSLEDVIEDEFAASGLELRASTFQDTWGRRQLSRWAQHIAQRYGCPATGGVVEGRKSTVESVGKHGGVEMTMKTNNGSTNKAHAFSFTMTFTIEIEGHPIPLLSFLRTLDIVQP